MLTDAVASGRMSMAYYPREQEAARTKGKNGQVDQIWSVYRRELTEGTVPCTDETRLEVLARIDELL